MEHDSRIEIEPGILEAVERVAGAAGATAAQFVNQAVLERLRDDDPEAYWAARGKRAQPGAIREFLAMAGNDPPIPGDELPEGWSKP